MVNRINIPLPPPIQRPNPPPRSGLLSRILSCFSRSVAETAIDPSLRVISSATHFTPSSWEQTLAQWVEQAPEDEHADRAIASERIIECIQHDKSALNVSSLELTSLPSMLQHCERLIELNCSDNCLTTLPAKMPALTILDCSHNQLAALPNTMTALTKLDCSNNRLTVLPNTMLALTVLSCSWNRLTALSINMSGLTILNCSDNQLTFLPENMTGLIKLNCSNNRLNELPEDMSALAVLICNGNQLKTLPENMSALTQLDCSWNRLTALPNTMTALTYLCCNSNRNLNWIPELGRTLMRNPNLRHLELANTAIRWADLPLELQQNNEIQMDIRPQALRAQALNAPQSTHTQSVHRSSTANILTLSEWYPGANLKAAYRDFSDYIRSLPTEGAALVDGRPNTAYMIKAAKEWIANPSHLHYLDPDSGMTIEESLGLVWLAIHDDTHREPSISLNDAKQILPIMLYESQRGYNLDDHPTYPKDDGQTARPICAGGTINKISEKLVSVIQGMQSAVISKTTFTTSLTATIKREIKTLREDPTEGAGITEELHLNAGALTQNLWNKIQDKVLTAMREEFKNWETIGGQSFDALFSEHTDFDMVMQYRKVVDDATT